MTFAGWSQVVIVGYSASYFAPMKGRWLTQKQTSVALLCVACFLLFVRCNGLRPFLLETTVPFVPMPALFNFLPFDFLKLVLLVVLFYLKIIATSIRQQADVFGNRDMVRMVNRVVMCVVTLHRNYL
jgi:uncharacterized membrane protein